MTLTQLDPRSALVVIDLQKGIVGLPTVHPAAEIVARGSRLAAAFRERGRPVVLVHVTGSIPRRADQMPRFAFPDDWTEFVPEMQPQSGDSVIEKKTWGAFLGTSLDADLRARGITQIVLCGIATSIGVESTARSAFDLGYHLTLVVDAITDRDAESHRHTVEKVFPRLGETASTEDVLRTLGAASSPKL